MTCTIGTKTKSNFFCAFQKNNALNMSLFSILTLNIDEFDCKGKQNAILPTLFGGVWVIFMNFYTKKFCKNLILVQFIILNSNLFSDLIYHLKFETYFKSTEPHKTKFAKL